VRFAQEIRLGFRSWDAMRWIVELFRRTAADPDADSRRPPAPRDPAGESTSERLESPADGDPGSGAGSLADAEGEPELEADSERPVDLRSNLDAGLQASALEGDVAERARRVSGEVQALALSVKDAGQRSVIAEISRRLRQGEVRLPSMPQVVVRVQRLLDSGRCHIQDLAEQIEQDPSLATRLVGIANSPFYQAFTPVQSLSDAVVRIGLGETRNIVLAVMLRSRVFRVPGREHEVDRLWEHSIAASISAQVIGAVVGEDPEAAFLLGLLHDIGRVVLLSLVGEVERGSKPRVSLDAALIDKLDARLHAPLGAMIAQAWRIDSALVDAIEQHHRPKSSSEDAPCMPLVARCADLMAHRLHPGTSPSAPSDADWARALGALGLDLDAGEDLEDEVREMLEARSKRL